MYFFPHWQNKLFLVPKHFYNVGCHALTCFISETCSTERTALVMWKMACLQLCSMPWERLHIWVCSNWPWNKTSEFHSQTNDMTLCVPPFHKCSWTWWCQESHFCLNFVPHGYTTLEGLTSFTSRRYSGLGNKQAPSSQHSHKPIIQGGERLEFSLQ